MLIVVRKCHFYECVALESLLTAHWINCPVTQQVTVIIFHCDLQWFTFSTELLAPALSTLRFFPNTAPVDDDHSHSGGAGLTHGGRSVGVLDVVQHLTIDGHNLISFLNGALLGGQPAGKHLVDLVGENERRLSICTPVISHDRLDSISPV